MISYFPVHLYEELKFFSDASFMGAGAMFLSRWIQIKFPAHWQSRGIAYLELFPIVAAHIGTSFIQL